MLPTVMVSFSLSIIFDVFQPNGLGNPIMDKKSKFTKINNKNKLKLTLYTKTNSQNIQKNVTNGAKTLSK